MRDTRPTTKFLLLLAAAVAPVPPQQPDLPTDGLPCGRSMLLITKTVTGEELDDPDFNPERYRYFIPFWL